MLNKVMLIGNVCKLPEIEIKTFQNGNRVAQFNISTYEYYKDKDGIGKYKTEYHKIKIYNKHIIEFVEKYVKVGSQLYIEGSIKSNEYEKDGIKRKDYFIELGAFNGELKSCFDKNTTQEKSSEDKITDDEIPF